MKKVLYLFVFLFSLFILNNVINAYTEYKIGDIVPYNDMKFYVIKNSNTKEDSVALLKKEPLTVDEISTYSGDDGILTLDVSGYGAIQFSYYSTDYYNSIIKQVVDAWKIAKAPLATEARLITLDELIDNLGYEQDQICSAGKCDVINKKSENTPDWVYSNNYSYWTMTPYNDSQTKVWYVTNREIAGRNIEFITSPGGPTVRPVIVLSKTTLGDEDENVKYDSKEKNGDEKSTSNKANNVNIINANNITSTKVNVPNTYLKQSIIVILLGLIASCASIVIYYIIKKRKKD